MGYLVSEQVLPHNLEVEQALLGALLHDNGLLEQVDAFLTAQDFFDPLHGRIFDAIHTFVQKGSLASPVTLKPFFEGDGALTDLGGVAYLSKLGDHILSLVNTADYGQQIRELHLRRQLIYLGEKLTSDAKTIAVDKTAQDCIEETEQQLFNLASHNKTNTGFVDFKSALSQAILSAESAFKKDSHVVGITTGLKDLDKQLGGLHPSDLIIVAGRPSMGKTALATNIAFNTAQAFLNTKGKEGGRVAFFSLEMSSEQIAMRLLGQESKISSDKIRRGMVSQEDFPTFVEVSRMLAQLPFAIDDTPALSVAALRTRARRLARKEGLGLIVVDYLQLLSGGQKNQDNRVQELSSITRGLKTLAKELNVPVIAVSQLSRSVEQREDKRPMLADLRESGSIEQDADVVMLIYREEYYVSRQKPGEDSEKMASWQETMGKIHNKADIMIAKQRHGPIGNISVHFNSMLTKFSDLARVSSLS
ncbi:replicative DNA helicase [Candidatus Hepatobacter penaei]|uniref:replicative DNA helicase n=1 Tax=Candidatus Hepatobacter penaei TaxID=1274402 RepID=UPI000A8AD494|nr:replicative DNA helicase [Candidatus Hepatobacter penaei]